MFRNLNIIVCLLAEFVHTSFALRQRVVYTGGGGGSKYKTNWSDSASYFGPLFEHKFAESTETILLQLIGKLVLPSLMGQNKLLQNKSKKLKSFEW